MYSEKLQLNPFLFLTAIFDKFSLYWSKFSSVNQFSVVRTYFEKFHITSFIIYDTIIFYLHWFCFVNFIHFRWYFRFWGFTEFYFFIVFIPNFWFYLCYLICFKIQCLQKFRSCLDPQSFCKCKYFFVAVTMASNYPLTLLNMFRFVAFSCTRWVWWWCQVNHRVFEYRIFVCVWSIHVRI